MRRSYFNPCNFCSQFDVYVYTFICGLFRQEISSRNPFSSYAKNPRFLMPEDRAGLLYDRLDDDEYTGKNTGQAEEERKLSSF